MAQRQTVAWPEGSMEFTVHDGYKIERFVSKKNEPPSEFIVRILRSSKHLSGVGVAQYLKDELDDILGEE